MNGWDWTLWVEIWTAVVAAIVTCWALSKIAR